MTDDEYPPGIKSYKEMDTDKVKAGLSREAQVYMDLLVYMSLLDVLLSAAPPGIRKVYQPVQALGNRLRLHFQENYYAMMTLAGKQAEATELLMETLEEYYLLLEEDKGKA